MKAPRVCAVSGISVAPKTEVLAQSVIEPVQALVSWIEVCWLIEEIQWQLAVACVVLLRILVLLRGRILPLPHGPRMSRPIVQDGCKPPRAPLSTAPKTDLQQNVDAVLHRMQTSAILSH